MRCKLRNVIRKMPRARRAASQLELRRQYLVGMKRRLWSSLAASMIFLAASASDAAPSRSTKGNYGGVCKSEDIAYVEGEKWWYFEFGLGPGTGWQYGGIAKRINADQVIIGGEVYTRIGSKRDRCR